MDEQRRLHSALAKLLAAPEPPEPLRAVKGLPALHIVVGEALPALTAKVRASIPTSKFLLHMHPPGPGAEALRASRPEGERTLFLALTEGDEMLAALSLLLKTLRPDHADLTVQTARDPLVAASVPKIRLALELELPNLQVDRFSALTRLRASLVNLKLMAAKPPLGARLAVPGLPALVCGAGPSLLAQLPFIAANASKFLVVACGHAAVKMKERGFTPDFIVEADPRARMNWSRLKDAPDAPLALLSCADPDVAARFEKRLWFEGDSPEFSAFCKSLGVKLPSLAISRGVIVSAVDFSFRLGCERVALAGCDLALSSDGASHAGSRRADDELCLLEAAGIVPGSKVKTTQDFEEIRHALEAYLAQSGHAKDLCNCSGSGARIEGVRRIPLEEFTASLTISTQNEKAVLRELPGFEKIADRIFNSEADLSSFLAASDNLSSASSKLAFELEREQFDQSSFDKAKASFSAAFAVESSCFSKMARILSAAKNKAEDICNQTPGFHLDSKDATGQLKLNAMKASLTSSFSRELLADLKDSFSNEKALRDPMDFESFKRLNLAFIAKGNPELARAIASNSFPSAASAGFSLHLRFEDVPQVSKTMPDSSLLRFSGLLSARSEAFSAIGSFAAGFDPAKHFAVIAAPGNYLYLEAFAKRYPGLNCLLLEPWPELLAELCHRCLPFHQIPASSLAIASHESLINWRGLLARRLAEYKSSSLEPRFLLNPKTAALPETRSLLNLEELQWTAKP